MKNVSTWNRRSALLYTVGSWTILGFLGFQSFRLMEEKVKKDKDGKEQPSKEADQLPGPEGGIITTISEDRLTETTTYRVPGKSFYVTSTVSYKPNFVPYSTRLYNYVHSTRLYNYVHSTRLYNYVQSFFEDTAGKEK